MTTESRTSSATPAPRRRAILATADTGRAYPVGAVLGSYRLLQQIGAGGMGRVFVAEHVRLGRRVALKVLRSEFSGNLEAVKRFFAEAHAVNCISHENIIEVSDFVESRTARASTSWSCCTARTCAPCRNAKASCRMERILRIGVQICSGLGAAHAAGIVHRDLKPDNIFLIERNGQRDFVKLLDFGVAKLMNATVDEASTFRSTVGMVVGTPDYMAPEQALGHPVDHLADIYAIGVILYEMVAGRRPFVADSAREVMVQHLTTTPCRPSHAQPGREHPRGARGPDPRLPREGARRSPARHRAKSSSGCATSSPSLPARGRAPARSAAAEAAQARRRGGADGASSRRRSGSAAARCSRARRRSPPPGRGCARASAASATRRRRRAAIDGSRTPFTIERAGDPPIARLPATTPAPRPVRPRRPWRRSRPPQCRRRRWRRPAASRRSPRDDPAASLQRAPSPQARP